MSSKSTATTATRAVLHPRRARQAPSPRLVSTIAAASPRASKPKPTPSSSSTSAPPSSSSLATSSASNKTLLLFRSLNLPKHNRITVPELEGAILGFVNSKLPAPTSGTSKRASTSPSSTSPTSSSLFTARSYIVTGNVVITPPTNPTSPSSSSLDLPSLLPELETSLLSHITPPTNLPNPILTTIFLRTLPELEFVVDHCPFDLSPEGRKGSKVHVVFLERRPERERVEELRRKVWSFGEGVWWSGESGKNDKKGGKKGEVVGEGEEGGLGDEGGKEVVLWFPNGHLKSKTTLRVVERALGMKGGMRGWTVLTGCLKLM